MRTIGLYPVIVVLFASSSYAQVPEPVAHFTFTTGFDDCHGIISASVPEDGNVIIGEDPYRGSVAVFPGDDPDVDILTDSLNFIELSTDAYAFDAVTYNIWINADAISTWARIITFSTVEPDGVCPEFFVTTANGRLGREISVTLDAGTDDPGTEVRGGLIQAGEWYMVTVSQDSTHLKLWVNGVLKGDTIQTAGKPVDLTVRKGMLGRGGWPDPLFKGKMDSFSIFDEVLSNEDVTSVYYGWWSAGCDPSDVNTVNTSLNFVVSTSKNRICIANPDNIFVTYVQIYDMTGNLSFATKECYEIIRHNLPSGLYIVKIHSIPGDYNTKIAVE
jgi:hypothetical protein